MENISREFQIFAKPVGAACNLRCTYCYYLDKKDLFKGEGHPLMTDEMLDKYVRQNIEASTENTINFSWHGGEPLMAGIEFYRRAVDLQKKYKPSGKVITNGIQTNGVLLDDSWCNFFASEGFTVGISIDGPVEYHNIHRRTRNDKDTFHNVISGFKLLKNHGVIPEILCVVNSDNVKSPLKLYDFFRSLGVRYLAFLPLVEPEPSSSSGVSSRSVPSEEFGSFLSAVFDEWVEKDIGEIKIQIIEEAARSAFNQEHTLCIFKKNCGGVPVLEHTGDFYSCDHFVDNAHLLGNINNHPLSYYLDCDAQQAFGRSKSMTLPRYCLGCEVRSMCNGECPKNRILTTTDGEKGLNYLCAGYKIFFRHCRPFVDAIAEAWKIQNS